jgi:AraC family transcriptional regulator of adaptative response/methylated-DNA-[protein]-cysteine methyltransferase
MNKAVENRLADDWGRIEKAIRFVEANYKERPDLEAMAASVHLSKYHFQRLFRRWAGISPSQFMQFLTLEHAKKLLAESRSVLDATYESGLSGPGRLHDLFVTFEAFTPGEYKRRGEGLKIEYGVHPSPFGSCLLAVTPRGICYLGFVDRMSKREIERQLHKSWPDAEVGSNPAVTAPMVNEIFGLKRGETSRPFNLLLRGTNFQINVWKALIAIPRGRVLSYRDVAAYLGRPAAQRSVASAIALNPISFLIPCHRVIASTGDFGKYHWGETRKKAILGWEAARTEAG